ncbi:DedA family protein [Arthrobacter sp. H14-L1]|uniref:DedA family protein n=1 Tax=Arthrobacter sp. H14-L1 TaxID=2996697 RepID=UPI0022710716|nr:DedA family protein [Arthrobacter sp. H14-L1]MCY0906140.1 DedA family protein [Arthrobacter sp. H14-L1]
MGAIMNAILHVTPVLAYLLITALVFAEDALFIGFILPGETAAILGGVLASQHHLQLWLIMVLVILAAVIGDSVGYEVGRHYGPRILNLRLLKKRRQKLDAAREFLARRGGAAVFLGRFTAFFRAVMPALAGLSRMPYRRFLLFNAAGGLLWGAAAVLLGYFVGNAYLTVAKSVGHDVTLVIVGAAALAFITWRIHKHRKARRQQNLHVAAD